MKGESGVVRQLAEQMGIGFEAFGMPRMAGRVLGWLVLADEDEVSLDELAAELGVSKASVSNATRLLIQMGVIRRSGRPGSRQAYFKVSADPWNAMLSMEKRVSHGFLDFAREARAALPARPDRDARLAEMEEAFELYIELLETFARKWREKSKPR